MIYNSNENEAQANPTTCTILLIWLCSTILIGKTFSYLHSGSVYITEFILGLLIFNNIKWLNFFDYMFVLILILYVIIGWWLHGSFFFAGKDMAWYYYLLFLRFFPRNFPDKYIKVVLLVSLMTTCAIIIAFVFPALYIYFNKYRTAIVLFFLYTFLTLSTESKLSFLIIGIFFIFAVMTTFKTAVIMALFFPLLLRYSSILSKIFFGKYVIPGFFVLLVIIYFNLDNQLLKVIVQQLKGILNIFKIDANLAVSNAVWRSEIWTKSLHYLFRDNKFILGDFPGHNFMESSILDLDVRLEGGDQLGIVRSVHNIVVQIFMKSGIVGLCTWFFYYFLWIKKYSPILIVFQITVLILAMTADILEVPSRGPLFYSYLVILEIIIFRKVLSGVKEYNYEQNKKYME